jgi:hypothetical protein
MAKKKPRYIDTKLSESNKALLAAWIDKRDARVVLKDFRTESERWRYEAMRRRFLPESQMPLSTQLAQMAMAQRALAMNTYGQSLAHYQQFGNPLGELLNRTH